MPASGNTLDSTIVSIRPNDLSQQIPLRRNSLASTTVMAVQIDDREIFKVFHDSMKDIGKFRQYIYYLGTSCDINKLRNKIHKLKARINRNFFHQRELIGKSAALVGSTKSELAIRRFEKCLCFTLASLNYYEDLLHKYSMLVVYFPIATSDHGLDGPNAVSLGFEDSTINADEVSFENHDLEDNETNRYIELLNQIQFIQTLREEIEQIDVYQLRNHATSYSRDFVENMHQYTSDLLGENSIRRTSSTRPRFRLRYYLSSDSDSSSFASCHRRKFACILTVVISILVIIGVILAIIAATKRVSIDMIEGYLYIFPLTVCALIPCAYLIPALLAVYFQHSKFEFLLFSRVSSDAPESCIYSQLINLASFVLIVTIYIRYRQIAELIRNNPTCGKRHSQSNLVFLLCAMLATFSLSVASNFPHANVSTVRICAINVTYLSSVAALYSEMFLSIWMRPLLYSSRRIPITRMILTVLCTVALVAFILFQITNLRMHSNFPMVITIWTFTSLLLIYIFTFTLDFSRIKIVSPKIFLTNDIIDDQMNTVLTLSI